jgi:hypothetical protein
MRWSIASLTPARLSRGTIVVTIMSMPGPPFFRRYFSLEKSEETNPIVVSGLDHRQDRAHIVVETRIVGLARMIEADIGAAFRNREGRRRRIVLDVVQMSDDDPAWIHARGLEDVQLIDRARRTTV